MRFDDRLLTVLNQPAGDRHDVAVRWRQLVDLVARAGPNAGSPTVVQALESIRCEAPVVDEGLRAAAARAVAALPLPLGLLEYFAGDRLAVSAPVLAAATLDHDQWQAIIHASDDETRQFIETVHPEVSGGVQEQAADTVPEDAPESGDETMPAPSLHEVVERIERRRRTRASMKPNGGYRGGGAHASSLFRWECGPGGDIAWVEGAPRGAVIGRSIAKVNHGDRIDPDVARAFMLRAPFRDAALSVAGDGPLSGDWKISGVPAFEPADGRFAGYRGIALREGSGSSVDEMPSMLSDPASLRELVHEIKTPLNAIIGFAEIIEGQYLGPADRPYRERAKEIVRQARLLLTAIDDLDFAAKVHSASKETSRVDLGELVERMTPALRDLARSRGVEIDASRSTRETAATIEEALAERLVVRMCSAVMDYADAGERLHLTVERSGDRLRVALTRPARLSRIPEEQLLGADAEGEHDVSLRLVAGLARLAAVELVVPEGAIALLFPRV
ncbi:MAG TPA: histidine kinase dimerization/phospho-acceptor domain-containing protein [Sphingomicrobium sp.]